MADKIKLKKNLKLGFKISLVGVIPAVISGLIFELTNFPPETMGLYSGVVLGFVIFLNLYLTGFFINKWKKWIFN